MQIGIVKRALYNDPYCGDECSYWQKGRKTTLCVVDGLGHGKEAEKAAREAVDCVARHLWKPFQEIFIICNRLLRDTRGVAMGIAVIDDEQDRLTYAGVGNTRLMIVGKEPHKDGKEKIVRLSSNYGIVGHGYRTLSPETVPLMQGDVVIMFTDGVKEMIDMSAYDEALRTNVERLGEKIIEDWRIKRDDAAVMVFSRDML